MADHIQPAAERFDAVVAHARGELHRLLMRSGGGVGGAAAGAGLGLAIVKSITHAHDGTLTLTPPATGGLCAMVHLPAAPPHPNS